MKKIAKREAVTAPMTLATPDLAHVRGGDGIKSISPDKAEANGEAIKRN